MAEIWSGKPVAARLTAAVRARADALRARGIVPTLALLRVGDDPDAARYAASICCRAEAASVAVRSENLPETASREDVLRAIAAHNAADEVHGILLFLPLPRRLRADEKAICAAVAPEKDVDGVTPRSAAGTYLGEPWGFTPCTAEACVKVLEHYGFDCAGKRAAVVGRSAVIGKPAAMLLLGRNATVTVCHSVTAELAAETRRAELLIAATGKRGLFGREHLAPGAVVLDVGGGELRADAAEIAAAYTPAVGGVGAVTSAVLMEHTVRAAENANM